MKFLHILTFSIIFTTNLLAFKLVLDSPKAESTDNNNSYIVNVQPLFHESDDDPLLKGQLLLWTLYSDIDRLYQDRIKDDKMIRFVYLASLPDFAVGDACKGHHRSSPSFHTECGKGLDKFTFMKERVCQDLGSNHRALSAAAMSPDLDHTLYLSRSL